MILLVDDHIQLMAIERSIKNLILLVLAIVIVAFLWKTMWFLGGLAIFAILVYFVYLLLKGNL
jgi:membrane protein YdbS with pleckstrin-like domain